MFDGISRCLDTVVVGDVSYWVFLVLCVVGEREESVEEMGGVHQCGPERVREGG